MTPSALLLDEHFAPDLARRLRERGHDVVAVLETSMTALPDDEIFAAAAAQGRRIVTENVADFRPLLVRALANGLPAADVLLVPTTRFRRTPAGSAVFAAGLERWLLDAAAAGRPPEDWLQPPPPG